MRTSSASHKVEALLYPRNIVIVGASDRPGSWSRRAYESSRAKGFSGRIYFVNPRYGELLGEPCYASLADLPETPDHLLIYVKAELTPDVIRQGADLGARSATIISAGFQEDASAAGRLLSQRLVAEIVRTQLGVSGPNCLGTINVHNGLCSMSEDSSLCNTAGPIAIVSQSGGMARFLNRVLAERGMHAGYVISSGNEVGLNIANYISYFAERDDTQVILCYNEFIHDLNGFKEACKLARSKGKHVIIARFGSSLKGKAAALAHTGALAGSLDIFESMSRDLGVLHPQSLDEMIEMTELAVHVPQPMGVRVAALTISGAFNTFLNDAADRHGIVFPDLSEPTRNALAEKLGPGASVGNPLDAGFAAMSSEKIFTECLELLCADPNIDTLLVQDELPREPATSGRTLRHLPHLADQARKNLQKPICLISMISHSQTDYSRSVRETYPNLAFLQDPSKALRALRHFAKGTNETSLGAAIVSRPHDAQAPSVLRALSEAQSLNILRKYGVEAPPGRVVHSVEEALRAANEIGYPVVAKIVSSEITHKSDIGGVIVGLREPEQLIRGYEALQTLREDPSHGPKIDGILIAKEINDCVEVVLSLIFDPELGPALMIGSGGTLLELMKDVCFVGLPTDDAGIRRELRKTKVWERLMGYRGSGAYDVAAMVQAALNLAGIAEEKGGEYSVIEVNPLAVCREGHGAFALDAMITITSETTG